jgi:hypothetical protein
MPQIGGCSHGAANSERILDRMPDAADDIGPRRSVLRRPKKRSGLVGVSLLVVLAIGVIAVIFGGHGAEPPSCKAQTQDCRQTSDGYWVPLWYYSGLSLAQGSAGRAPSTAGTQPTASQLQRAGATPDEAGEAESYEQSEASQDSGDDSGSDDGSDDDGGDDGGGDGGD